MIEKTYRPDIDGLRAIAVLAVLAFHLDFSSVSGGFVGVDVFFVISGFLIASIIGQELEAGKFSIWRFYERRMRRIFPALFAMTIVATGVGCWLLLPVDLTNFAQSVAAAAVFASNLLFIAEAGYFDADAKLKPLLHTWSLAVEEQFYLVFPLLLWAVWTTKKLRNWLLAAMGIVSFLAALIGEYAFPATNFFLSPTRFWELMIGAILALTAMPVAKPWMATAIGWIGGGMIAWAAMVYTPQTPFPGLAAIPPCLGAAALIYAGRSSAAGQAYNVSLTRLLSQPLFVGIGLISYSLYLWHWPIIVYFKYVTVRPLELMDQVTLAVLALLLAVASWHWIEQPFRRRRLLKTQRHVMAASGLAIAVAFILGVVLAKSGGWPARLDPAVATAARDQIYRSYTKDCQAFGDADFEMCRRGAPSAEPRFMFLGDSHAGSMSVAVFEAADELDMAGLQITVPGYRPFLGFVRPGYELTDRETDQRLRRILDRIPEITDIIVLAHWRQASEVGYVDADGGFHAGNQAIESGLSALFEAYPKRRFWLLSDYPISDRFGANRYARQLRFGHTPDVGIDRADHAKSTAAIDRALARLAAHSHVLHLSLDDVFCDKLMCTAVENGRSLYRDPDHLTLDGARKATAFFEDLLTDINRAN